MGETNVAVPRGAFRVSNDGGTTKYVLDASKERLEQAPQVEGKKYDRLYSRQDAEPTFIYWGVTWYDLGPSPSAGASATPDTSTTPPTSGSPRPPASAGASATPSSAGTTAVGNATTGSSPATSPHSSPTHTRFTSPTPPAQ